MLFKDFGQSKVYSWGIGVHNENGFIYDIPKNLLENKNWIFHLSFKTWIDLKSFEKAYNWALENLKRGQNGMD